MCSISQDVRTTKLAEHFDFLCFDDNTFASFEALSSENIKWYKNDGSMYTSPYTHSKSRLREPETYGNRYLETALRIKSAQRSQDQHSGHLLVCKPQAQQGHRKEWAGWGCAGEVSPIVPLGLPCPRRLDSSAPQAATSANGSYHAELLLC